MATTADSEKGSLPTTWQLWILTTRLSSTQSWSTAAAFLVASPSGSFLYGDEAEQLLSFVPSKQGAHKRKQDGCAAGLFLR